MPCYWCSDVHLCSHKRQEGYVCLNANFELADTGLETLCLHILSSITSVLYQQPLCLQPPLMWQPCLETLTKFDHLV